ncbi:glycosyltransferase family 2 protein [Enterococcus quebecensis]|uniref:Glycosyltransferase n=1 Tax=Enterococcus quebecensis TaxID=903983 RepID=A0A1E5GR97_9ENTE|nr:glycosyltransferase family 2 protein [Enterococcus quebecensis]OEG15206.1 glycosyltransferase [Enterococcus quebecensis]OJG74785.1 hypothetical protein RV12_GL002202 [Enterococcus quebecensis]
MKQDKLFIVVPAYNEEENIETVVKDWYPITEKVQGGSELLVISDGSKDQTFAILKKLELKYPNLTAVEKKNSGHGGTVLYGYQYAIDHGADFIFQTDSDGQTLPEEFWSMWEKRNEFDIQIGKRSGRQDGFSRVLVTKVLKLVLFLFFGKWVEDANTPFRLMKRETLIPLLDNVPTDYNLSNVLLTVLYEKNNKKIRYQKITFKPRQGGVNSINLRNITKIGWQAIKDFSMLRKNVIRHSEV